jgi:hypothetical protein
MIPSDFSANSCSGRRPMHESAEKSEGVILGRWFSRKSDRFLGTGPHYGMRQKMGFPPRWYTVESPVVSRTNNVVLLAMQLS